MTQNTESPNKWVVEAAGAAANSKAAEKLSNAIENTVGLGQNIIDYIAGPKRIQAIGEARVAVRLAEGKSLLKLQEQEEALKQRTADRLLRAEMRNQQNIESITAQAFKALPKDDSAVSDTPASDDFINLFFEESKGIGNEQMQQLWGKLLAGEVTSPGSFHTKTLRVLKDMRPEDALVFSRLCNLSLNVGGPTPIIFNLDDDIYKKFCPNFTQIMQLEALGLIRFDTVGGFTWAPFQMETPLHISYGHSLALIRFAYPKLQLGRVLYTEAGLQIAQISQKKEEPEFFNYVIEKWRKDGHHIDTLPIPSAT